jgi:hypothetical protein
MPAFAFRMVLAVAVTILALMTCVDRNLAEPIPPTEAIYHPQLLVLY